MNLQNRSIDVVGVPFRSRSYRLLAASDRSTETSLAAPNLAQRDIEIRENRSFPYVLLIPHGMRSSRTAILFFHGLNEKSWDKYVPWARELCLRTGRPVVLFPIAFHMNRSPASWSDPRAMSRLASARRRTHPTARGISFANVALSTRLEVAPQRFLWSGLQTYYDVLQLVEEIRTGNHPILDPEAEIGLFGYSIGAFLVEMLMFENPHGVFSTSKGFLFCGGPTLAEMSPVSKYIIDSEAKEALVSFYGEDFDSVIERDPLLIRLFERIQSLGTTFKSMLFPTHLREMRLAKLAEVGKRLGALLLKRDRVMPSDVALRTLTDGLEPARAPSVETLDFPFDYTHEQPFPLLGRFQKAAEGAIRLVMRFAADHLT